MQQLASDVGGLQRVLTNVKTRGGWGEVQLGALLEQVLTPEQFARNVKTREGGGEMVEFAIKLPGEEKARRSGCRSTRNFRSRIISGCSRRRKKPIFAATEEAMKQLEAQLRKGAQDICSKYINPPRTTDFAIMFLPTEGLYAEAIRRVGLVEQVQRDCRVVLAGPTTLAALLNSLQMGFRTLAIQKRSSEVWNLLAAVRTEFGKFGAVSRWREEEAAGSFEQDRGRGDALARSCASTCRKSRSCRIIRSRCCRSCSMNRATTAKRTSCSSGGAVIRDLTCRD